MGMATDSGTSAGNALADTYGSKTASAGTAITRLVPPSAGKLARVSSFIYVCGSTAHTVTVMPSLADTIVTTDAASGQAVVAFGAIPTAPDGSALAASDWVTLQHEDGSWAEYKVSSVSGLNVTLTANLSQKVKAGSRIFFHGAPADHATRQFLLVASTTLTINDVSCGAGSATRLGEPVIVHSDNATAAGSLQMLAYRYVALGG